MYQCIEIVTIIIYMHKSSFFKFLIYIFYKLMFSNINKTLVGACPVAHVEYKGIGERRSIGEN